MSNSHAKHLRDTIQEFTDETGSAWGQHILDNFSDLVGKFWLVKPKAAELATLIADLHNAAA